MSLDADNFKYWVAEHEKRAAGTASALAFRGRDIVEQPG